MIETEVPRERALIVGVERPDQKWPLESSMEELVQLVDTAGADVVASTTQKLSSPNPRTFVGSSPKRTIATSLFSTMN